jgi:EAL and modified HD-GYP domain-containing signal transduction protein
VDGSLLDVDRATQPPRVEGTVSLEALRLGWRPIVSRDRRVIGMRIEACAVDGRRPESLAALLAAVLAGLAADESLSLPRGLVVLSPGAMAPDASLARWRGPRNVLLEFGSERLDATHGPLIEAARRAGLPMVLRSDGKPVPRDLRRRFSYVIEGPGGASATEIDPTLWVREIQTRVDVQSALARGAAATIGWPLDEPVVEASAGLEPSRRAVLDIVRLIQSDADVVALERAFKNEPSLAYMLLALVNSPAFTATAPIASLRHAILLLGYKRLVRWLVLLLGVSSQGSRSLPLVHLSVQRGFFLEALGGRSSSMRDDLFVVGAFSLLDRVTGQSHERLYASASLPRAVLEAVRAHQGVYGAYLALAEVIERGDAVAAERAAQLIDAPMARVNAALLQSLAAADALTLAAPVGREPEA